MFSMFPGTSDGGHGSGRFGGLRGFHFDGGSGGGGRLPAGGQQDAEVVLVGHGRKPSEDAGGMAAVWFGMGNLSIEQLQAVHGKTYPAETGLS